MTELKTRPNDKSVREFLERLESEQRRGEAFTLLALFSRVTQRDPVMWGDSIVGFGSYSYTNSRGEFSWLMTGFSPRKRNMTLYVMQGFDGLEDDLKGLGKVKHAKSCLYVNKLSDIDLGKLEGFLTKVVADMESRFDCS